MEILWIDDDPFTIQAKKELLVDNGHHVIIANTPKEALNNIKLNNFDLIIIDIMMHDKEGLLPIKEIKGGMTTGIALARAIKKVNPSQKIVGCSISNESSNKKWFNDYCNGFISKGLINTNQNFVRKLENIVKEKKQLNVFIVHGHDDKILLELKNFLQNKLQINEPIILREQPSNGKTIIEKFEHYSEDIDLVFVLMTPDDLVVSSEIENRRTRQNVIFELGYFYGKLQRKTGKVILIYKGDLEIPSDISGVIYINAKKDISSIAENIREELNGII